MKLSSRSLLGFLAISLLASSLVLSSSALAKNNGHGKGHDEDFVGDEDSGHKHSQNSHSSTVLIDHDRSVLLTYLQSKQHCPPGLAKKHNGCLPPGQAKKYVPGMVVEPDVIWQPLPASLVIKLSPPPMGARYVQVDQNVLLVSEATRKILDAVSLLSAVNK